MRSPFSTKRKIIQFQGGYLAAVSFSACCSTEQKKVRILDLHLKGFPHSTNSTESIDRYFRPYPYLRIRTCHHLSSDGFNFLLETLGRQAKGESALIDLMNRLERSCANTGTLYCPVMSSDEHLTVLERWSV